MALSAAKKASDRRHLAKLTQLNIKPYQDEGDAIRAAAAKAGQSTQAYILQAVRARMAADKQDAYLIHISKAAAEASAKAKGQTLDQWLQEHQG